MKHFFKDFSSGDESDHKTRYMRPETIEKLAQKNKKILNQNKSNKVIEKEERDFKKWVEEENKKKNMNPLEKSNYLF